MNRLTFSRKHLSGNYDRSPVNVEFLLIHYSAVSLDRLLTIFNDHQSKVSCHLVISAEGEIIELVPCLDGPVYRAWHAGHGSWKQQGKEWTDLNSCSIGVELINYNGTIFEYPAAQMRALQTLIRSLKQRFTALRDPGRILGHEQISGYRGKVDPGALFPWKELFEACYPGCQIPERESVLSAQDTVELRTLLDQAHLLSSREDLLWQQLNSLLEKHAKEFQQTVPGRQGLIDKSVIHQLKTLFQQYA